MYTRRSFLLSRTFQYISNWSKVFEFLRTLYQLIIYVEVQIGSTVLIYHSWCNSNFESTYKKPSLITLATFFWCSFSIKLSLFQRRANKIITMQYDRFYLQNCKAITFAKKKINHTKNKLPNGPSHLYIFWLNFDKGNHSFLHHFLLLCETDFLKNAAWKNE